MRLAGTDLDVSRIGFGTAALGRSVPRRERVRLVETAHACGITHFDTAPLYGAGAAEDALAALTQHHRDGVTIATKVGIEPPSTRRLVAARIARRPSPARGNRFAPAEIRASLQGSLRRLRTSYVDLLLLHEVEAEAVGEELLAALDDLVRRGDARYVGVATTWRASTALLARRAAFPAVVQTSADAEPPPLVGRGLVLHSALAGRTGSPPELLRGLADRRPDALLLFGSRNVEHVRETAAAVL